MIGIFIFIRIMKILVWICCWWWWRRRCRTECMCMTTIVVKRTEIIVRWISKSFWWLFVKRRCRWIMIRLIFQWITWRWRRRAIGTIVSISTKTWRIESLLLKFDIIFYWQGITRRWRWCEITIISFWFIRRRMRRRWNRWMRFYVEFLHHKIGSLFIYLFEFVTYLFIILIR